MNTKNFRHSQKKDRKIHTHKGREKLEALLREHREETASKSVPPLQGFLYTGFPALDLLTGGKGLPYGSSAVFYGEPGFGVTTLLLTLARSVILKTGKTVRFFDVQDCRFLAKKMGLFGDPLKTSSRFVYGEIGRVTDLVGVMDDFFSSSDELAIIDGLDSLSTLSGDERPCTTRPELSGSVDGLYAHVFKWMHARLLETGKIVMISTSVRFQSSAHTSGTCKLVPACASVIKNLATFQCRLIKNLSPSKVHILNCQQMILSVENNHRWFPHSYIPTELFIGRGFTYYELLLRAGLLQFRIRKEDGYWTAKLNAEDLAFKRIDISTLSSWLLVNEYSLIPLFPKAMSKMFTPVDEQQSQSSQNERSPQQHHQVDQESGKESAPPASSKK